MTDTRCRFLELPVELRLLIYDFAVINARVITVGTAKLTGDDADVFQRQFGNKRSPFKGIPRECEPVVDGKFNSALLLDKAAVEVKPWTASPGNTTWPWTASKSLLSVNRKISREFRDRLASPPRRETSLFVNYPHGLHVLQTATPELLGQSRSVHLAGLYYPPTNDPYWTADRLRARPYLKQLVPPEYLPGDVVPDAIGQLSQLVKSSCGPDAPYPLEMLELRIYYPGHSYSAVFSESSPLAIALLNIPWGKIELLIYRGNHGIGEGCSSALCP